MSDRGSIYCYPNTNVLKNKLNIHDEKELMRFDARITAAKLLLLREKGIIGNFSKTHFINIHKFIFEDIYPFAGELRKENIAKGSFSFADWMYIDENIDRLLKELEDENYLLPIKDDKEKLSERLAYYLSEFNVLHPFREGNGRTIREFIRELALKNGYELNLKNESADEFLEASILSIVDTEKLKEKIFNCLEKKSEK
jgi:cell filamentation protein